MSVIMPAFEVKASLAVRRVRRNLQACAAAHRETGAPITVHTQGGSCTRCSWTTRGAASSQATEPPGSERGHTPAPRNRNRFGMLRVMLTTTETLDTLLTPLVEQSRRGESPSREQALRLLPAGGLTAPALLHQRGEQCVEGLCGRQHNPQHAKAVSVAGCRGVAALAARWLSCLARSSAAGCPRASGAAAPLGVHGDRRAGLPVGGGASLQVTSHSSYGQTSLDFERGHDHRHTGQSRQHQQLAAGAGAVPELSLI